MVRMLVLVSMMMIALVLIECGIEKAEGVRWDTKPKVKHQERPADKAQQKILPLSPCSQLELSVPLGGGAPLWQFGFTPNIAPPNLSTIFFQMMPGSLLQFDELGQQTQAPVGFSNWTWSVPLQQQPGNASAAVGASWQLSGGAPDGVARFVADTTLNPAFDVMDTAFQLNSTLFDFAIAPNTSHLVLFWATFSCSSSLCQPSSRNYPSGSPQALYISSNGLGFSILFPGQSFPEFAPASVAIDHFSANFTIQPQLSDPPFAGTADLPPGFYTVVALPPAELLPTLSTISFQTTSFLMWYSGDFQCTNSTSDLPKGGGLGTGEIIGIVFGSLFLFCFLVAALFYLYRTYFRVPANYESLE